MRRKEQPEPATNGARRRKWHEKNFITEVLIPSLMARKGGVAHQPVFPELGPSEIGLTWIGHASFLIQMGGRNLLIDPNWANWLFVIRRLKRAGFEAHHLPNIDLVLITHAHFDHLNRRSLRQVASDQPIVVPNGVSNLVHDLGFEEVHELGWWDKYDFGDISITFTPAKHWGARMIADKHRGYGGFCIRWGERSVYHVGDSAYFKGFREIGAKFEPEITLMPIGSYDTPSGRDHHIGPEESVKAFLELRSQTMVPMHFGTFRLSHEPMHEPAQRLILSASEAGVLHQIRFLVEGVPQVF